MMESALFWLLLNILTIMILAFYSMEEMAAVSFNRVRLQYYVSQGSRRAIWLNTLLQNPAQLFATTLIGVNVATFIGSECAREFHIALGISPDLAPLSQVVVVIIFGELAPMFAARRYPEQVALLGVPVIYFSAKLLSPLIWLLEHLSKVSNTIMGGQTTNAHLFLTQDELQKIIEDQEEDYNQTKESSEFNTISSNIFRLQEKCAKQVMSPLSSPVLVSAQMTVGELRKQIPLTQKHLVVYQKSIDRIIGIIYIKDLIRASDSKKLREFCIPPRFIPPSTPILQILKQFRRNSENIAIVLNDYGHAIGYLTFEDILEEIFGETGLRAPPVARVVIDQTVDGRMTLEKVNQELSIELKGEESETLSEWILKQMEHPPEAGETLIVPPYEFTIKETSLLEIKSVEISTIVL
jgi:putative hemolysin